MPPKTRNERVLVCENYKFSMNNSNRDLLVLFNQELMTPQAIEHEVEQLHGILYVVEKIDNMVASHEAIDINKYKIFNAPQQLRAIIHQRELKPFVFLNCKN